ncbi:serine--tRNA ligase [Profundibacterium mesophilum]|uniref:Serine--tRNA ligase n=1 Tax=Profundibacterium mesophilum KAUST100406-0324 TaxID=1037889 RepID=A0A921NSU7_9RHOB|nr:serine--tRNA ligase [Profundibacterium mesophilum]KAF0674823.1 Serine--tRNA ligase [Profundibacterium mesophilum KAUST100406-0324]
MHDIRIIRDDPAAFDAAMARRGLDGISEQVLRIDDARRAAIHAAETAKAEQNAASKKVGAAKASGDEAEFERLRALVSQKKSELASLEAEAKQRDGELTTLLMTLPNILDAEVPAGRDEADNVEIRRWGTPAEFDFTPREHYKLEAAAGLDFETAARLSGARFVVMRGAMARLHRALAQFMIDMHVDRHGLEETNAPVLVRDEAMLGTGQLPKFAEDSYETTNGWWLIPTSEVTLTNSVREQVLEAAALPLRLTAHSLCFRSEAGSAGKDTAGMLRQHQFEKVEMVSITSAAQSTDEHERMTGCAEAVLQALGLPFRTMLLCEGDTGFGARRTHDIEVWLPGQNTYREISSVSNMGDFQARRMPARMRPDGGGKPEFVHTLNGSGLAVGRCLIAVLENGQRADGSVALPEALHPWIGGKTEITASGKLA